MSYAPLPFEPSQNQVQLSSSTNSKHVSRTSNRRKQNKTFSRQTSSHGTNGNHPLIVHCHLCWDWVWQRPQQFISRLSRHHQTLFVETLAPDPSLSAPLARFRVLKDFPNLTVLSLQFPA